VYQLLVAGTSLASSTPQSVDQLMTYGQAIKALPVGMTASQSNRWHKLDAKHRMQAFRQQIDKSKPVDSRMTNRTDPLDFNDFELNEPIEMSVSSNLPLKSKKNKKFKFYSRLSSKKVQGFDYDADETDYKKGEPSALEQSNQMKMNDEEPEVTFSDGFGKSRRVWWTFGAKGEVMTDPDELADQLIKETNANHRPSFASENGAIGGRHDDYDDDSGEDDKTTLQMDEEEEEGEDDDDAEEDKYKLTSIADEAEEAAEEL
jgi:hypothetical protein